MPLCRTLQNGTKYRACVSLQSLDILGGERERTKVQFSRRVVTQTNSSLQTEVKRILSDKKREREKERKSLMYNENPTYWRDRIF